MLATSIDFERKQGFEQQLHGTGHPATPLPRGLVSRTLRPWVGQGAGGSPEGPGWGCVPVSHAPAHWPSLGLTQRTTHWRALAEFHLLLPLLCSGAHTAQPV